MCPALPACNCASMYLVPLYDDPPGIGLTPLQAWRAAIKNLHCLKIALFGRQYEHDRLAIIMCAQTRAGTEEQEVRSTRAADKEYSAQKQQHSSHGKPPFVSAWKTQEALHYHSEQGMGKVVAGSS